MIRFISWKNHLCHQKGDKKLHITHYYGNFIKYKTKQIPKIIIL